MKRLDFTGESAVANSGSENVELPATVALLSAPPPAPKTKKGKHRPRRAHGHAPSADDMLEQTFAETAMGLLAEVRRAAALEGGSDGECWE